MNMKTEKNEVMISGIIPRRDNENLDKNGSEGNEILTNYTEDPKTTLRKLKMTNMDRVVMGHLNINHLDKNFLFLQANLQ